jgi:dethiobiotin synthetase
VTGLLVTGTDTGVGKTHVACLLAAGLAARGLSVGVQKPCETGVDAPWPPEADGGLPPGSDAERLARAAGSEDAPTDVLPYLFPLPAAPLVAARQAGTALDLAVVAAAHARLAARHDVVLVEGAGGLLVPLTEDADFVELARRLDLDVLIVARSRLGTVNHTLLTERAALQAGLSVRGVVLNDADGAVSVSDRLNLDALSPRLFSPLLAECPHGASPEPHALEALLDAVCPRA